MGKETGEILDNLVSADSKVSDKKKKKRIIIAIVSALLVALLSVGLFIYKDQFMAVTMRIQRLVGTVNLYNEGKEQDLREKMKLGAGQTVETAGESLIMVSLDDTKLMTMEESSKADIKARGKKLEFDLIEGNLFFNVTEKLKKRETFDIYTSTMICGIRGTSAYVGRDSTSHEILMVTDGLVHVIATNPVTKETTEVDVPAGQMITIYLDEEAEGDKTISIRMQPFKEEDLPAMALDTMRKNKALMERVAKATGFSSEKLATLADLSSTKGVSMYGEAVNSLKEEGVEDAIPFMGNRAHEMVTSANSAVNIAKEDLPLEVAIIQGYRDVMDVGTTAGYNGDNMRQLMNGTRTCVEETFKRIELSDMDSEDKVAVAIKVSETIKVSAGRMTQANLSTEEIGQVMDATTLLFTNAIDSAKEISAADLINSVDRVSNHVTGTVDEEMNRSANGEETVEALLKGVNKKKETIKEEAKETKKEDKKAETDKPATPKAEVAASNVSLKAPVQKAGPDESSDDDENSSSTSSNSSNSSASSGGGSSGGNGTSPVNHGTFDAQTGQGTLDDGTSVTLANGPSITINGSTNISLPLTMTSGQLSGDIDNLAQINWQSSANGVTATDANGNTASKNTDGTYTYTPASGTSTTYPDTDYQNFVAALNGATGGVYIPDSNGNFSIGNATVNCSNGPLTVMNGTVTLPFTYRDNAGFDICIDSLSQISVWTFSQAEAIYGNTSVRKNGSNKGPYYTCDGANESSYGTYTETATEIVLINYMGNTTIINSSVTIDKSTGAVTNYP